LPKPTPDEQFHKITLLGALFGHSNMKCMHVNLSEANDHWQQQQQQQWWGREYWCGVWVQWFRVCWNCREL